MLIAFVGLLCVSASTLASSHDVTLFSLPQKFVAFMSFLNPNGDQNYTINESVKAFRKMNQNDDSCVTINEFMDVVTKPNISFTKDFSKYFFASLVQTRREENITSNSCKNGLYIGAGNARDYKTDYLIGQVVVVLTSFCEEDKTRYIVNEDCRQLPQTCHFSTELSCNWACFRFLFNVTRGRTGNFPFLDSIQAIQYSDRVNVEDIFDREFRLLGPRMRASEPPLPPRDPSEDGCFNRYEFIGGFSMPQCGFKLGFTPEHSEQRFLDISKVPGRGLDPNCDGIPVKRRNLKSPNEFVFREHNIQSMINMCEADKTRYRTNRDCKQIFRVCTQTHHKVIQPCKDYVNNVLVGKAGYAYAN